MLQERRSGVGGYLDPLVSRRSSAGRRELAIADQLGRDDGQLRRWEIRRPIAQTTAAIMARTMRVMIRLRTALWWRGMAGRL